MLLTAQQIRTYQFIDKFILCWGKSPTIREIAAGIGIESRGVIHRYLRALIEAKLIEMQPCCRRSIRLVAQSTKKLQYLPLVGKIAAGKPIQNIEDTKVINLSDWLLKDNRVVFKVEQEDLGVGIHAGDYLLCGKHKPKEGEIAVVLIRDCEIMLARIVEIFENTLKLQAMQPSAEITEFSKEEVAIQGTYLGLIRYSGKKMHS